jgi:fibronectin-binding autotransporter adhesin
MEILRPVHAVSCPASLRRPALAILFFIVALPSALHAQITLHWDGDGTGTVGGGAGTWDTTLTRWSTTSNGTTYQAWTNASNNDAVFSGTAGTVTLGTAITVRNLTFATTGYTLTGSALTLTGGTIDTGTGSQTISSVLTGTAGLNKTGTGTLTLNGANTFTGGTTISAGRITAGTATALGTGAITLADNATSFVVSGNAQRTIANAITVDAGSTSALIGTTGTGSFIVYTGNVTLNRATTLFDSTTGRTSFDGNLTGNVGILTIGGANNGRVTLGGTNTLTGDAVVNNGVTLQLNSTGQQVLPLATNINTSTSGRLWIVGNNSIGSLTGGTGSTVQVAAGGVPAATLSLGANNTNTTFSGVMQNGTNASAPSR